MEDYRVYRYQAREIIVLSLKFILLLFSTAYLFYRDLALTFLIMPFTLIYLKIKKSELKNKRDLLISRQFCDAMQFISSSLSAGKNLEMSIMDAVRELAVLYGTEDEIIIRELKLMVKKLAVNVPITEALEDFSSRTGNGDIECFKDAVKIARASGGNIIEITRNVYYVLSLKKDARSSIEATMTRQKLNLKILMLMPFFLMFFMSFTCPAYIEPLYSPRGNVVSSLVLLMVLLAWAIGRNINKIKL